MAALPTYSKLLYINSPYYRSLRWLRFILEGLHPKPWPSENPDHLTMDPVFREGRLSGVVLYCTLVLYFLSYFTEIKKCSNKTWMLCFGYKLYHDSYQFAIHCGHLIEWVEDPDLHQCAILNPQTLINPIPYIFSPARNRVLLFYNFCCHFNSASHLQLELPSLKARMCCKTKRYTYRLLYW